MPRIGCQTYANMAFPSPDRPCTDPIRRASGSRKDERPLVMIRFLSIRDLAIVDALDVEFDLGFNVLTGETGAGKSIIIGALGLLVGERSTGDLVRTGAARAVVQATFEDSAGAETIVRREIPTRAAGASSSTTHSPPRRRSRRWGGGASTSTASTSTRSCSTRGRTAGCSTPSADSNPTRRKWRPATHAGRTRRRASRRRGPARRAGRARRVPGVSTGRNRSRRPAAGRGRGPARRAPPARQRRPSGDPCGRRLRHAVRAGRLGDFHPGRRVAPTRRAGRARFRIDGAGRPVREAVAPLLRRILAHGLRSYAAGVDVSPDRLAEVEARLADIERLVRKYGGVWTPCSSRGGRLPPSSRA